MALVKAILEEGIKKNIEKAQKGGPATYADLVAAIEKYAYGLTYPPPTGVPIGAASLKKLLLTIPQNPPIPIGVPTVKMAIKLFTIGIVQGFPANPADLSAVPTVAPGGLPPIDFLENPEADADKHAAELASAIHDWFITGTFDDGKYINPNSGPVPKPKIVPWS